MIGLATIVQGEKTVEVSAAYVDTSTAAHEDGRGTFVTSFTERFKRDVASLSSEVLGSGEILITGTTTRSNSSGVIVEHRFVGYLD